ncbi:hypothetical protein ABKN59_012072 [Abortiporus biennis]
MSNKCNQAKKKKGKAKTASATEDPPPTSVDPDTPPNVSHIDTSGNAVPSPITSDSELEPEVNELDDDIDDDVDRSDVEEEVPLAKKGKQAPKKKQAPKTETQYVILMVLCVLDSTSDNLVACRISIESTETIDHILEEVYLIIGCSGDDIV